MFDLVLIPSILEGVHYKHAIVLRNRWMVEQADYVIAMVERKEGGAYATLQYAKKKKKKIINLAERKITPVGYQTGVKIRFNRFTMSFFNALFRSSKVRRYISNSFAKIS